MFCGKCGSQLRDDAKFCPNCGSEVYKEPTQEEKVNTTDVVNNIENAPAKKKVPKALWISIVAVVCVVALVASYFLGVFDFIFKSPLFVDNSSENYRNSYNMTFDACYVARNDKYIFYINDKNGVVRMNADGSNRKSIVDDTMVNIIYLSGETLYYHSSEDRCIYSCDIDGENDTQIVSLKNSWFTVAGGYIYYIDGYYEFDEDNERYDPYGEFCLYRIDLNGDNREQILSYGTSMVSIQEDSIVYTNTDEKVICATDLEGNNKRIIYRIGDTPIYNYKVYKNKLYYTVNGNSDDNVSGIYAIDIESGSEEKIVSTVPGDFTFWKEKLIYVADRNSSAAKTYICDLDGENSEELLDSTVTQPLVMGDYMYYLGSGLSSTISVCDLTTNTCEAFEMRRYDEVVFTDKYIFYIDSDDNIYRCDHDGKNVVKLTNADCDYLFTYKNGLYYSGYANGYNSDNDETASGIHPYGFFRLDENGKNCYATELNGSMSNYVFYNDYVYFTSSFDSHVYRTKIDNIDNDETNRPFIRRTGDGHYSSIYFIENDWIYFSYWKTNSGDSATIARMSLDGEDMEIVIESPAYDLTVYENKIYYLKRDSNDDWQLRRVDMDGTDDVLMLKADISEYVIVDNVIYYINSSDKNIYKINLDGTKRAQLTETACDDLNICGDRIYYTDLYSHGYFYSMKLDGSDCKAVIEDNKKFTEATDYKTQGIDDAAAVKEENKDVSYSASDVMTFEDPEFEAFLCEMFEKEKGTITGADLLSVKFFGYYEGAPTEVSSLRNRGEYGRYGYLYENSVLYSTNSYPSGVDEIDVLCGDEDGDAETYRAGCIQLTVRSNEWMAEHVMPYLYYFKNMKHVAFGYCWVGDNPCLPIGVDWEGINPHARYMHDPYDPLYE